MWLCLLGVLICNLLGLFFLDGTGGSVHRVLDVGNNGPGEVEGWVSSIFTVAVGT